MSMNIMSERIGTIVVGMILLSAIGCSNKDAAKCANGLATARQALTAKDLGLASQWREYAYKQCEDVAQLAQLDKEIVDRQAALAKEASDKAKTVAQQQQLLSLFKSWVGQSRTTPERSANNMSCEGGDDVKLKASKERFCAGARAVTGIDGAQLMVRYWEKTPADAAHFSVRLPLPVTCNDLGGNRVLKEMQIPASNGATVKRTYCELTEGALSGLQAIATEANSTELRVFSAKYPEQDPALRMQIK
jgi:hypothetical protein